jgi:hypothetical protein
MAPLRSSSSGCEPAVVPKIEMWVSWGRERERELCVRTLDVPVELFMGFLCSIKPPPPATRRRRRTGRKGKDCKKRRMLSRNRVADSVREQDAGVVDVIESTGCGSGAEVCVSGDSVLGDLVGHVAPVHVASGSSGHSQADCGLVSSRTVLRPSVLSLPSPRPTRVVGVGRGLVTGHGGTRPELQVFESADFGACLVPESESDYESCADGSSDDLGSSESAVGAGAAVAAAVAAAAALVAAASARAAISAVQDSLGSARRQRKRGRRNAKKFVGSALSRVWRARTVAQISISSLSPVAAKFVPAPRWGNSPMERYPLVLASASSVPAFIKGKLGLGAAVAPEVSPVSPPSTPTQEDGARKYPDVFRFEDSDPYFYLLHKLEGRVNPNFVKGTKGSQVGPQTSHALRLHQIYVASAPYLQVRKKQEREEFPVLAVDEPADSGSCLVSSEFAEGAGAGVAAAGAAAVAFAAAASARAAISAVQDSLGTARRLRKKRKRDAKKLACVVADAAVFGPVAEVPTARVVDDEICGCLDGDALFDICFQVLVPTLSISAFSAVHLCVALLKGDDAEFLRYAMRDTSRGIQLEVHLQYWLDECAECSKGRFETAAFMKEIIRGEGSVRYEDLWRMIS